MVHKNKNYIASFLFLNFCKQYFLFFAESLLSKLEKNHLSNPNQENLEFRADRNRKPDLVRVDVNFVTFILFDFLTTVKVTLLFYEQSKM